MFWMNTILDHFKWYYIPKRKLNLSKECSLVSHILKLHLNFADHALKMYKDNFEQVYVPIKENEKLSNWHMKDLVNIKMNTTKFHKGINRSIKLHKEILELSVEGAVYKNRRDQYKHAQLDDMIKILEKDEYSKNQDSSEITEEKLKPKTRVLNKKVINEILQDPGYKDPV